KASYGAHLFSLLQVYHKLSARCSSSSHHMNRLYGKAAASTPVSLRAARSHKPLHARYRSFSRHRSASVSNSEDRRERASCCGSMYLLQSPASLPKRLSYPVLLHPVQHLHRLSHHQSPRHHNRLFPYVQVDLFWLTYLTCCKSS